MEPITDPPLNNGHCIHRGGMTRLEECQTCGGKTKTKVFACAKHGECSLSAASAVRKCASCGDFAVMVPPKLPPLTRPANLMMFYYPKRSTREVWERQQEVIRESIGKFDGRKLCAIAYDDSTDEAAIDCSLFDEVHMLPNDPTQWELPGWRWAMERLKDQPGFTVRLHAKGASRGVQERHLQAWWELTYKNLLNVDAVRNSLQTNIITGVMRSNRQAVNLGVPWHYSGSMYAFRNADIFADEWQPKSKSPMDHYVEAWPALVVRREQAGCLAFDGVRDLYQPRSWLGVSSNNCVAKTLQVIDPPVTITPQSSNPIISIVVPAWNEATRITTCLKSIAAQTLIDFECFVIDDGSTDTTGDVVRSFAASDQRFQYFHKDHSGIGLTLNYGFAKCKAEFLTWISADSWVERDFLKSLHSALAANPSKVMAYSDWNHVDEPTGKTQIVSEPAYNRKALQSRCKIGPCWLFRSSAKALAGDYVDVPCEDYYMHLMLSGVGDFIKVNQVLGSWRNHPDNTTNRISVPEKWASNSIVKARARWQQAKYKVAYLCPTLDAASVGWLLMNVVNDLSDDYAMRHILGDVTHVTPGVDCRLNTKTDNVILTDEALKILTECDIVHINNDFPDFRADVFDIIKDKPLVIHMHSGWHQRNAVRMHEWKNRGVQILTCTPGHKIAIWIPNPIPVGDGNLTNEPLYSPLQRNNPKLKLICHHNYQGGKGLEQIEDMLDGIDRTILNHKLRDKLEWSVTSEKKMRLLHHLEHKQPFDICIDTITHGYCGMATWEAMAIGQAVICKMDDETQAEYVRWFGSVPPVMNPRTIDDVVEFLVLMLNNRRVASDAGKQNREWIVKNYSAAKLLQRYEAIYAGVLV